jgi:hypothetical protein
VKNVFNKFFSDVKNFSTFFAPISFTTFRAAFSVRFLRFFIHLRFINGILNKLFALLRVYDYNVFGGNCGISPVIKWQFAVQ